MIKLINKENPGILIWGLKTGFTTLGMQNIDGVNYNNLGNYFIDLRSTKLSFDLNDKHQNSIFFDVRLMETYIAYTYYKLIKDLKSDGKVRPGPGLYAITIFIDKSKTVKDFDKGLTEFLKIFAFNFENQYLVKNGDFYVIDPKKQINISQLYAQANQQVPLILLNEANTARPTSDQANFHFKNHTDAPKLFEAISKLGGARVTYFTPENTPIDPKAISCQNLLVDIVEHNATRKITFYLIEKTSRNRIDGTFTISNKTNNRYPNEYSISTQNGKATQQVLLNNEHETLSINLTHLPPEYKYRDGITISLNDLQVTNPYQQTYTYEILIEEKPIKTIKVIDAKGLPIENRNEYNLFVKTQSGKKNIINANQINLDNYSDSTEITIFGESPIYVNSKPHEITLNINHLRQNLSQPIELKFDGVKNTANINYTVKCENSRKPLAGLNYNIKLGQEILESGKSNEKGQIIINELHQKQNTKLNKLTLHLEYDGYEPKVIQLKNHRQEGSTLIISGEALMQESTKDATIRLIKIPKNTNIKALDIECVLIRKNEEDEIISGINIEGKKIKIPFQKSFEPQKGDCLQLIINRNKTNGKKKNFKAKQASISFLKNQDALFSNEGLDQEPLYELDTKNKIGWSFILAFIFAASLYGMSFIDFSGFYSKIKEKAQLITNTIFGAGESNKECDDKEVEKTDTIMTEPNSPTIEEEKDSTDTENNDKGIVTDDSATTKGGQEAIAKPEPQKPKKPVEATETSPNKALENKKEVLDIIKDSKFLASGNPNSNDLNKLLENKNLIKEFSSEECYKIQLFRLTAGKAYLIRKKGTDNEKADARKFLREVRYFNQGKYNKAQLKYLKNDLRLGTIKEETEKINIFTPDDPIAENLEMCYTKQ